MSQFARPRPARALGDAAWGRAACALLCVVAGACQPSGEAPAQAPSGSAAPSVVTSASASPAVSAEIAELRRAELTRSPRAVAPSTLAHRDRAVRVAAARALARIGGDAVRAPLRKLLADEDPEVVAWAAYGLGFGCRGDASVRDALAGRAASLSLTNRASPDTLDALLRAVGRCGAEAAEGLLRPYLEGATSSAAAHALADVARERGRLREETFVALLAASETQKAPGALSAFARVANLPEAVRPRLRERAEAELASAEPTYALRSLGRHGDETAAAAVARLLEPTRAAGHRVEAAKALGAIAKRSGAAQHLEQALAAEAARVSSGVVLLALVRAVAQVGEPGRASRATLSELARRRAPDGAEAHVRRRVALVRCAAAAALSTPGRPAPELATCGGDAETPSHAMALREHLTLLLDATGTTAASRRALRDGLASTDVRARALAIEAGGKLGTLGAAELVRALGDPLPGPVAAAAEALTRRTELAAGLAPAPKRESPSKPEGSRSKKKPSLGMVHPDIERALTEALARQGDPEALSALLEAAGALGLESASKLVESHCASPWPALRAKAEAALRVLAGPRTCAEPEASPAPDELGRLLTGRVRVELDTDAGALAWELDAEAAPLAVTRVVELAKSGFYDGMVVHRVVPGFVAQLGSPTWDGYGGPTGKSPLRCETSPLAFEPLRVGVALAGRDTGASQVFVTLGPARHLDGVHAWLGTAAGPWDALEEGDVVRRATVTLAR